MPGGRRAVVKLWDDHGHKVASVTAVEAGEEPLTLGPPKVYGQPYDDRSYPLYDLLTANGITEVFEFRRHESVFRISDDADVRARLLQMANRKSD